MHRTARLLALLALGLATTTGTAQAAGLTIYSSFPLQGDAAPLSRSIVAGAQRALADAGGTAAGQPVRYVSLDDSTKAAGKWTVGAADRNAVRATRDATTVAYLGEFNSGATAISLPVLNEAGIAQISPGNTAAGLTVGSPGTGKGEPDKYYPSGKRTYARLLPNDHVQGRAAAVLLQQLKATSVLVVDDGEVYGRGVAASTANALRARGIRVATRRLGRNGRNAAAIARTAKGYGALFYGGITDNGAPRLFNAVAKYSKLIKVGSDGISERPFAQALTARAARNIYTLSMPPTLAGLPPAAQALHRAIGNPEVWSVYGYEAMALALDAVNRGGGTRPGTVAALFATHDRDSVLGRYSIDPNGDTTLTTYGVYRVAGHRIAFDHVIDAGA